MTIINEQEPKKRNWMLIGLGGAALFCLCAVAVAFFMFYQVGKKVADSTKTDPESASKAAHEIVDYTLPEGYREQMAMDFMIYSFVVIGPESIMSGPLIILAQFEAGMDQEQMEQQLRQSFEQQSGTRGADMRLVEVKKKTIRGEETEVALYEGTDSEGNDMRQLITTFPGKGGTVMLMVMGETGTWDQGMVDDFIESIR